MDPRRYCVYNETNECFLSLGVTVGNNTSAQLKGVFGKGPFKFYEGSWIKQAKGLGTVGLLSPRDLIYLDTQLRVVRVLESFPRFRVAPQHPEAKSMLALPVGTIESTQTQLGDHLVICVAEEMQARLRNAQSLLDETDHWPAVGASDAVKNWLSQTPEKKDWRESQRKRWPHLSAVETETDATEAHAVRDISTTGLYLLTDERWPLGTRVRMNLQRTDALDDATMIPTSMELRVSRWGSDGVGLEFVTANAEHSALVAAHVR
ncbi:PilZ domain-containing protein [Occallatibacter riparius]|uniref:PilZ domain-containing protein n=1 Tax=Occallatibacter riparius TaxID=1002689 RepID=A0A9J7BK84_9BACT|nr:PilZ domain-containing protein [Occallatibacter riparius]UWZ82857.1 PilZ domain-containing protein [Occallatibacter riparius]